MPVRPSSTRKFSSGSSRVRKDIPRTEEAWYVVCESRPFLTDYWSCVKQNWVPWIAGDEAEAYYTEAVAERAAFNLAVQMPLLSGMIGVLRRL